MFRISFGVGKFGYNSFQAMLRVWKGCVFCEFNRFFEREGRLIRTAYHAGVFEILAFLPYRSICISFCWSSNSWTINREMSFRKALITYRKEYKNKQNYELQMQLKK